MFSNLRISLPLFALAMLAACNPDDIRAFMDKAGGKSVRAAVTVLDVSCSRSIEKRKAFLLNVNTESTRGYVTAADCDRDGEPDFPLQLPAWLDELPPALEDDELPPALEDDELPPALDPGEVFLPAG